MPRDAESAQINPGNRKILAPMSAQPPEGGGDYFEGKPTGAEEGRTQAKCGKRQLKRDTAPPQGSIEHLMRLDQGFVPVH